MRMNEVPFSVVISHEEYVNNISDLTCLSKNSPTSTSGGWIAKVLKNRHINVA